jgi:hypothetical protein
MELMEERVRGIEPPYRAWEARVLPLNYTRRTGRLRAGGFRSAGAGEDTPLVSDRESVIGRCTVGPWS